MEPREEPVASPVVEMRELFCPVCGYDLRGIESTRCPECGGAFDRSALAASNIPWVHRRYLGTVRAFWKTVRMATVRPEHLGAECARPISYADALRFRLAVVLTAWVAIAAAATLAWLKTPGLRRSAFFSTISGFRYWRGEALDLKAPVPLILNLLWLLFWLWCASGIASWWFAPRRLSVVRQNRAVALSQYAVAPLALWPATLLLVASVAFAITRAVPGQSLEDALEREQMVRVGWMAAWTPVFIVPVLWWATTLRLLLRASDAGWARVLSAAVVVPVLVVGLGAASLVAIHFVANFVVLVVTTW